MPDPHPQELSPGVNSLTSRLTLNAMQAVCVRATASLQLSTAFCQIHQWQPRLCLSRVLPVLQPLGTRARCSALTAVRSSDCTDSQDSTTVAQSKQLHRFYAPQLPPVVGAAVELDPEEARHAMRVLRLQPGGHHTSVDVQYMTGVPGCASTLSSSVWDNSSMPISKIFRHT